MAKMVDKIQSAAMTIKLVCEAIHATDVVAKIVKTNFIKEKKTPSVEVKLITNGSW